MVAGAADFDVEIVDSLTETHGLLDEIRWTPPQYDFLSQALPRPATATEPCCFCKLLRTGNQLGKTWVGLAELIWRCLGAHPFIPVPKAPITAWVICDTFGQSIEIQQKFWDLVPKDALAPGVAFDPVKGFRGRHPVCRFANGSIVRFKTTNQKVMSLASATIDLVLIDELTTPAIFGELQKRVMRRGGVILLTLTPINAPSEWLAAKVAEGDVIDIHHRMLAENFVPMRYVAGGSMVPGDGPPLATEAGVPLDEDWIREERRKAGRDLEGVRCDGEWQIEHKDRELLGYSDAVLWSDDPASPHFDELAPGPVVDGLGMDHGEGAGREMAYLVSYDSAGVLWVLGEYASGGTTTAEQDAAGIERLVTEWHHDRGLMALSKVRGDTNSGGKQSGGHTINELLTRAFKALEPDIRWEVKAPDKSSGSVKTRTWMLNTAMIAGRLRIHELCTRLIESCRIWKGEERGRVKDPIDAVGYIAAEFLRDVATGPRRLRLVDGDGRLVRRRR